MKDVLPILIAVLQRHPVPKTRDQLAATLFNLIKKPDQEQRKMIMDACVQLARTISPERFEAELLPQCWEQISHKYPERRILVADSCGTLASYVPSALRNSLLLSMLTQVCEFEEIFI